MGRFLGGFFFGLEGRVGVVNFVGCFFGGLCGVERVFCVFCSVVFFCSIIGMVLLLGGGAGGGSGLLW